MAGLPSFVIIGAMKSATSTLYEQLRRQPGIFLPNLKEPNFFSNDEVYSRGMDWYRGLFDEARPSDLLGEASTHYTKLPTYPQTVARMQQSLGRPRLIYVMRDPMDRLISQYIHEWSQGEIRCDLDEAVTRYPELSAYSCYARQLVPFIEAFGKESILPIFFDRLTSDSEGELERVARFIGYEGKVQWHSDSSRRNVSADRVRKFPLYDFIVENPVSKSLRRALVPKSIRTRIRDALSMKDRPIMSESTRSNLERQFDDDLATLSSWLGADLNSRSFRAATAARSFDWR